MVSDYDQNLWKAVLEELKNTIPERLYNLWFKETGILSSSNNVLQIHVPNEIIAKKISEKHLQDIEKAVFKCSGSNLKIEMVALAPNIQQAMFDFEQETMPKLPEAALSLTPAPPSFPPPSLNKHYTFANFVVGHSNHLAHAAALAVARAPGVTYNPLFMYGAVGLGKTHLLQAICHDLMERNANYLMVYLSCEEFINEFINAVEQGDVNGFRYKYRHADVLLIDDIHFLAGKERTQEEFFHTFNTLYNAQKQIILSSDSPPSEIPELKERIVSRFKWGLVTQLNIPSFETRVAIVKKKARLRGVELLDEVCQYIAEHIVSNIRELEGAVNHLVAAADCYKEELTFEFARRALRDMITIHEPEVQLSEILEVVSRHFNVKLSDLQSKKRPQSVVTPRQIGMFLAKKLTKYSLQEIGGFFGGRDHTTVLHAVEKLKEGQAQDPSLRNLLAELEKEIFLAKKL